LVRLVNAELPPGRTLWTKERLIGRTVLDRAPRRDGDDRLLALVAGIKGAAPELTLEGIARRPEAIHELTPRGSRKWQVSSVKMLLDRARARS
jgi:hypothetical protein